MATLVYFVDYFFEAFFAFFFFFIAMAAILCLCESSDGGRRSGCVPFTPTGNQHDTTAFRAQ
ncbi:MAG: hypothetical protein J0H89_09985 [Rhizobiales bacterium]|nr:hypothetical protein [Hyphomicrobiales bacterium]